MSGDLSGFSMFELFKAEAESHAAALSEGLLALETNPSDLSHVEKLMRAAHSVKGAARIVGLDAVVELAHVMEDCFVAVQKGDEKLNSARVDQLLQGVDVFQELAKLPEDQVDHWLAAQSGRSLELAEALGRPVAEPVADSAAIEARPPVAEPQVPVGATEDTEDATKQPPTPEAGQQRSASESAPTAVETAAGAGAPPPPAAPAEKKAESATEHRTVPVNATNLNRIMRLAGESMIDARRLQSMQQSLSSLRDAQRQYAHLLDKIGESGHQKDGVTLWEDLRGLTRKSEELLQDHSARLERALWRSERTSTALYHQVIGSRMRPFSEGTQAFPRMIRDLSRSLGKQMSFELLGGSVAVDRDILRKLEAPLNHILRNCIDHGIETPEQRQAAGKAEKGRVVMEARHHAGMLTIEVRDDGRGIDADEVRKKIADRQLVTASMAAELSESEVFEFLFLPGFSTASQVTEVSGRGVGLDVVQSMVQEVSGTVRIASNRGEGTTFTLHLPVTLSVIRAALAEIGGEIYAFPLAKLVRIVRVGVEEIRPVQGRQQFMLDDFSVGLLQATEVLDLPATPGTEELVSVIVIGRDQQLCGITVDRFVGERDLVVRPLDPRLGKVPHISAAAISEAGEPLLIVDIDDMLQSIRQLLGEGRLRDDLARNARRNNQTESTGR